MVHDERADRHDPSGPGAAPPGIAGIYAIFDPTQALADGSRAPERVAALIAGGVRMIQLRAKSATTAERIAALESVAPLCRRAGCRLVINDDLAAANAGVAGVTGLHLGQDDIVAGRLEQALVVCRRWRLELGISTHNLDQVDAAQACGASHLGFGPVRATGSKLNPDPVTGIAVLQQACARSRLGVVAIGGLGIADIAACRVAGAAAVAMISELAGDDPGAVEERARAASLAWRGASPG